MSNVLITSVSRKFPMVRAFCAVAHDWGARLIGVDMDECAPARAAVDVFATLPPSTDSAYGPALLDLSRREGVGLILPSRDGDIDALSALGPALKAAGVLLPLPGPETVALCRDKRAFAGFLAAHGFRPVPELDAVTPRDLPAFRRARIGAASAGAGVVDDMAAAEACLADDDCLLHPYLRLPEFTIDVLSDFDGTPLQAVVRERRAVRSGESRLTTVCERPHLAARTLELAGLLGLKGHTNFQAFAAPDEDTAEPIFIEANLRFGGASILSVEAGLHSPARIMALAFGDETERRRARNVLPIACGLTLERDADGDRFYRA